MELLAILWKTLANQFGVEGIMAVILGYVVLTQRHANQRLFDKVESNRVVLIDSVEAAQTQTKNQLAAHIKEEEKEFGGIEKKFGFLSEGMKLLQQTMTTLNSAMERYAITNHDVLDNEISEIDSVIYMSATSVTNILKNMLVLTRKNKQIVNEYTISLLVSTIAEDVERDRRKYHVELTTKGVATKTISLWEEIEKEAFESYLFRIIQTFKKLAELEGNGTVDILIERECELLRDFLHGDFMKRLQLFERPS